MPSWIVLLLALISTGHHNSCEEAQGSQATLHRASLAVVAQDRIYPSALDKAQIHRQETATTPFCRPSAPCSSWNSHSRRTGDRHGDDQASAMEMRPLQTSCQWRGFRMQQMFSTLECLLRSVLHTTPFAAKAPETMVGGRTCTPRGCQTQVQHSKGTYKKTEDEASDTTAGGGQKGARQTERKTIGCPARLSVESGNEGQRIDQSTAHAQHDAVCQHSNTIPCIGVPCGLRYTPTMDECRSSCFHSSTPGPTSCTIRTQGTACSSQKCIPRSVKDADTYQGSTRTHSSDIIETTHIGSSQGSCCHWQSQKCCSGGPRSQAEAPHHVGFTPSGSPHSMAAADSGFQQSTDRIRSKTLQSPGRFTSSERLAPRFECSSQGNGFETDRGFNGSWRSPRPLGSFAREDPGTAPIEVGGVCQVDRCANQAQGSPCIRRLDQRARIRRQRQGKRKEKSAICGVRTSTRRICYALMTLGCTARCPNIGRGEYEPFHVRKSVRFDVEAYVDECSSQHAACISDHMPFDPEVQCHSIVFEPDCVHPWKAIYNAHRLRCEVDQHQTGKVCDPLLSTAGPC